MRWWRSSTVNKPIKSIEDLAKEVLEAPKQNCPYSRTKKKAKKEFIAFLIGFVVLVGIAAAVSLLVLTISASQSGNHIPVIVLSTIAAIVACWAVGKVILM